MLDQWRLHAEQDARQVGEFFEQLQLALQAFLLVTQARRPVPVGHHQRQLAFTPLGHMAMCAGGRLQLAFKQALQMSEALGMAKNGFERLGFA